MQLAFFLIDPQSTIIADSLNKIKKTFSRLTVTARSHNNIAHFFFIKQPLKHVNLFLPGAI